MSEEFNAFCQYYKVELTNNGEVLQEKNEEDIGSHT